MDFGKAIEALKEGKGVARKGWNGKNIHIYLEEGSSFKIGEGIYKGKIRVTEPVICMFNSKGTHQPGWLASQSDILADDWVEVS